MIGLKELAVVTGLALAFVGAGTGAIEAAAASKSEKNGVADELLSVDIGAITFSIETPRHTQYVVTKVSVSFLEASDAEHYRKVQNVVRLRDSVLTVLNDAGSEYGTSQVNLDHLSQRLRAKLDLQVPDLHEVQLALLGTRNVPRR